MSAQNQHHDDRLRVVTVNSHQPYVHLLAGIQHDIDVIDRGLSGAPCLWDTAIRPLPARTCTVSSATAHLEASRRSYDVAIAHNVTDMLALNGLARRMVLLIHCTLTGRILYEGSRVPAEDYLKLVRRYTGLTGTEIVFVSDLKRRTWRDLPGRVIPLAVSGSDYGGYTGELPAVLRVSNLQRRRDIILNHRLQEEAVGDLPTSLIGLNPDVPGARIARDWDDLRDAYRRHRCFLVTNHVDLEDGYNLAVLEAMATGMPVVTTPHPTSPVRHGREGLVGRTASELTSHLERLLNDRELASRLGRQARATALARFPYGMFVMRWDALLRHLARPRVGQLASEEGGRPVVLKAEDGLYRRALMQRPLLRRSA